MTTLPNTQIQENTAGSRLLFLGGFLLFFAAVLFVLFYLFGKIVPPEKIGVRRNYFSIFGLLNEGYASKGLAPGLHLNLPGVSEVLLLPRGFQLVNLNSESNSDDLNLSTLEVPTTDGSKVNTDVTLIARLYSEEKVGEPLPVSDRSVSSKGEGESVEVPLALAKDHPHGGPNKLINAYGDQPRRHLERLSQTAQDELRRAFSELSTIDFYNPTLRENAAVVAQDAINNKITEKGMELWATLVRRYTYVDPEIDNRIFQKNLQVQKEKYNAALTKFAEAQANNIQTAAKWDAKIKDKLVEGDSYSITKRAEADSIVKIRTSEGDRALQEKTAEIDSVKNRMLATLPGASVYLAREMVGLLKTLRGGVVTGIDPYDTEMWVKKLVGSQGIKRGGAQSTVTIGGE